MNKRPVGRLHVITDTTLQPRFSHEEIVRLAIAGGADTIQFRQKSGETRKLIHAAREVKLLCAGAGVTFVVNDRLDVAIAVDADGVHLGQQDFPIPLARKILGEEKVIGGSAATLDELEKCLKDGADYIGFGPVFLTSSKSDAGPVSGLVELKKAVQISPVPIIAIGGMNVQNTPEVMRAGAWGIAVISAVCCQENPEQAVQNLLKAMKGVSL